MKKNYFIILTFLLCLAGCLETKYTEVKEETAEVLQLSYIPSQSFESDGIGFGASAITEGISINNVSFIFNSGKTEEVYAVVLRCSEHKKTFAIKSKDLYSQVKVGDIITLQYQDLVEYDTEATNNKERIIDTKTISFSLITKNEK